MSSRPSSTKPGRTAKRLPVLIGVPAATADRTLAGELLYRKVGRRYEPAYNARDAWDKDLMPVGTWRMTYAYGEGGRRYEYGVTPDTASFAAAALLAREAMERAIMEAIKSRPQLGQAAYTKRQLAAMEACRQHLAEVGVAMPTWWQHSSAHEIAQAALDAVTHWREGGSDPNLQA